MSASSKKKLRKEQEAVKLTEQQLTAQKEAKKLNLYTTIFVVVLAVLLVVAVTVGISQTIANSGVRERKTTALTVNGHDITNAELNYFYMDAVNQFSSQYGQYAMLFGMDTTKPLNQQIVDEETGKTWADDFLEASKENAKAVYAMVDAAEAEGFTLSEEETANITQGLANMETFAKLYGYKDAESYLKAIYGKGAELESYTEYSQRSALANAYYADHEENLKYLNADLRAVDAENFENYSSFTFNSYYLSADRFLTGGTTDEEGKTTYSDEEKAAAVAAAEEAAKALTGETILTVADLDAAIAALPINAESETAASAESKDLLYTKISSDYIDWIADSSRQEGDIAYFPNATVSTDDEGVETETVNGYYVVRFTASNDNTFALANVRHILLGFEGGTKDETTGVTTYSDEEKAASKSAAEETLEQWKSGDAVEDTFAALANEKSADGDGTTGGLYENVYPGQMVPSFNDWCFAEGRKAGDTGIVESQYGYHVMYYVGDSEQSYRDYMIENELRAADMKAWNEELVASATSVDGDTSYIMMDLVLAPQK